MRTGQSRDPEPIEACDSPKILHVINSLELGGTQNLLLRADRELRRRGLHSRVCVLGGSDRTHDDYHVMDPTYLNFRGDYRNPLALQSSIRRLREVVVRERPDILHSYLWTADFISAMAVRRGEVCHVSQIVDRRGWMCSRRWIHSLRRSATRRAFRSANTRFLAVSEAARRFAVEHLGIADSRTSVAYNGVDWSSFQSVTPTSTIPGQPLLLGTAGRLEPEKGHRYLIESVKHLLDQGHDIRLDITGEGTSRSQLEEQVSSLGIGDRVRFLGWVADVHAFYLRINAFVVPSIYAEGLPTTILEAMASGCVVVASDIGGAAEAIEDGMSGMVVPPADVARLTEAVETLVTNQEQFAAIGIAARRRVESLFTTQQMVDTMVDAYRAEIEMRSDR